MKMLNSIKPDDKILQTHNPPPKKKPQKNTLYKGDYSTDNFFWDLLMNSKCA